MTVVYTCNGYNVSPGAHVINQSWWSDRNETVTVAYDIRRSEACTADNQ